MKLKLALAAAATVMAGPSFGIAVNLSDFHFSPAIDVAVTGNETYMGRAGEFTGFIGGVPSAARFAPNSVGGASFTAYCAELTQAVSFGVDYDYSVLTTIAYFGAQKAADLSRLFTGAAGFVTDQSTSGAMQAAVWEIIYEVGTSYNLDGGAFRVSAVNAVDANSFLGMNAILANLAGFSPAFQLSVLQNADAQDLITASIPEPGTWALLAAGLGVIGMVARRRKA